MSSVTPTPPPCSPDLAALQARWLSIWPDALRAWSKFTLLKLPALCLREEEVCAEGLRGSFAMIRLADQSVIVSLPGVVACGVHEFALEILAHEIGHHVLAPASLTEHARMIARMRWSLPTVERLAPLVANLYSDLLVNDRLQRSARLGLADLYRILRPRDCGPVWSLYLRIYELLWSLPRGSLGGGRGDDRLEGDAQLGMRVVRSYARDWIEGSGRFAALFLPHLLENDSEAESLGKWADTRDAAAGGDPGGLAEEEPGEREGAIHPAEDPDLNGESAAGTEDDRGEASAPEPTEEADSSPTARQGREPFEYGEILRATGISLDDHEAAVRYYRERARPHLIPFPRRVHPVGSDPLPEGLEPWDIGHPLDNADWLQSVFQSPSVVPGMTTVQRVWGTTEGQDPKREPLDLDLYVDSSGSMANPQRLVSYPTLAGAIVCLSALRAGASVQATLWSGKQQVTRTRGFVRDEDAILRVLTGYYGGGTAFPLHALRETYENRRADARPSHILVISDDGVTTMFDNDEMGQRGWNVTAAALAKAAGGGSFVLKLREDWVDDPSLTPLLRARDEMGWTVYRVASWEELVEFARRFSRLRYVPSPAAWDPECHGTGADR